MLWKPDVCIYHGGCDDGFGAAYAVWKRWGDDVEYVEGRYGAAPPDVSGKNVIIVDFSYKYPDTRHVSAAIRSYDHNFDRWDSMADDDSLAALVRDGGAILRAEKKLIAQFLAQAFIDTIAGLDLFRHVAPASRQ